MIKLKLLNTNISIENYLKIKKKMLGEVLQGLDNFFFFNCKKNRINKTFFFWVEKHGSIKLKTMELVVSVDVTTVTTLSLFFCGPR